MLAGVLVRLGTVIAERRVILRLPQGRSQRVTILIGSPQPLPDQRGWYCPYRIRRTGGSRRTLAVAGEDAVQALQLVFRMIGSDLLDLERRSKGRLLWPDGSRHNGIYKRRHQAAPSTNPR
jgi:hypothetical protein